VFFSKILPNLSTGYPCCDETAGLATEAYDITIHQSFVEWLKYKTAKPLLYMVYRLEIENI